MSRVCLVGVGAPGFRPAGVHAGPGLRLEHLTTALVRAGHEVLVLAAHNGSTASAGGGMSTCAERVGEVNVPVVDVHESGLESDALRERVRAFRPDAIVGVTVLGAALACRLRLDVPMWADVFGDIMAEAQARAVVQGNDATLVHFWSLFQAVLERADRFSAVSRPQADALIGQLGLAGRLGAANAGQRLVSVIPCAAETGTIVRAHTPVIREVRAEAGRFLVLWTGSFNTWCDVDTLYEGLEQAMTEEPAIIFAATGGPVPGHDEATFRRFASLVNRSPHADRFLVRGWVQGDEVEAWIAAADVGVVVERDLYERRLGSENRVVQWMARGLPCVTTARSELGRCLVENGLAFGCRPADPRSLAEVLLALASDRGRTKKAGEACLTYGREHFNFDVTAAPLSAWCAAPLRAADADTERAVTMGLFSEPTAMVRVLEAYLDGLRLRQIAYRSLRWAWRRGVRRIAG